MANLMYDHNNQHFSISQTSKQNNTQSYNILDVCIITVIIPIVIHEKTILAIFAYFYL